MELYTLQYTRHEGRELVKIIEIENKYCVYRLLNILISPKKDIEFNWETTPIETIPIEIYNNLNKDKHFSLSPHHYLDIIIKDIEMRKEWNRLHQVEGCIL